MNQIVMHQTVTGYLQSCARCEHRVQAHADGAYLGVHKGEHHTDYHECLPAIDCEYTWYRVVGFGLSGTVQRSVGAAWKAYLRAGKIAYGYASHDEGTSVAAHSAALTEATTRRAAIDADISVVHGKCGEGVWRRSQAEVEDWYIE